MNFSNIELKELVPKYDLERQGNINFTIYNTVTGIVINNMYYFQ